MLYKTNQTYPDYLVYEDGRVFNFKTGRFLNGTVGNSGYHQYRLKNINNKYTTIGIHRLLLSTFKPIKNLNELVVNHIDGDKSNNSLSNLEWCTYKENQTHAGKLGLTEKCKPIACIKYPELTVQEFNSIIECSDFFGVPKDYISYRINEGTDRVFPEGYIYVLKKDLESVLQKLVEGNVPENKYGRSRPIKVKNIIDDVVTVYENITTLSKELDVGFTTLVSWIKDNDRLYLGKYLFKYLEDDSPWKEIKDMKLESLKTGKGKVVKVLTSDKKEYLFKSAIECANHFNITPTCLNNRLKSNGNIAFKDGNRYMYIN